MKEERNIYVLKDYSQYYDAGDIEEVSPNEFSDKYPSIHKPRLILMPIQADPMGITQYIVIKESNLIYFFKKAKSLYML
mgnify:FL=1